MPALLFANQSKISTAYY